jgi:hypothetical protein
MSKATRIRTLINEAMDEAASVRVMKGGNYGGVSYVFISGNAKEWIAPLKKALPSEVAVDLDDTNELTVHISQKNLSPKIRSTLEKFEADNGWQVKEQGVSYNPSTIRGR